MTKIGITYDARFRNEIERLQEAIDVIEIKNIEPQFVRENDDLIRGFGATSMHVQYLPSERQPVTLNLIDKDVVTILSDETSLLYQTYDLLQPCIVSFHLGFSAFEIGTEGRDLHNYAISETISKEETYERLASSIAVVKEMFAKHGYSRKILLENLDYHPTGAYEYVCNPSFIRRLAEDTECGILLDIGHTIITSETVGTDPVNFVEEIGAQMMEEVHITAPLFEGGEWLDINQPFFVSNAAVELLQYTLSRAEGDLLLNVECPERIEEQVQLFKQMI